MNTATYTTDKKGVNTMDTTSESTYVGYKSSFDDCRQAMFSDAKDATMNKPIITTTTKASTPAAQYTDLCKQVNTLLASGKLEQAKKLSERAEVVKASIRNRGANGASDATVKAHMVSVPLSTNSLKADGYYRVLNGKLFNLPTGTQSDKSQFVGPRYKMPVEPTATVKTSPVKRTSTAQAVKNVRTKIAARKAAVKKNNFTDFADTFKDVMGKASAIE
jgi:hypothetical protein